MHDEVAPKRGQTPKLVSWSKRALKMDSASRPSMVYTADKKEKETNLDRIIR
ncbi:hypothetical protein OS493_010962 [Desmophyllum pertusum]|uniref:Uncharacterized protein n=1 Tax=Desmophyllum pertusum TaxID=174260 RepID=A0A9X0CY39_9CNID|nr:hypothetical protein OS493_010962 [Desmophyllum pertusum]